MPFHIFCQSLDGNGKREVYLPKEFAWQEVAEGIFRYDFKNISIPIVYHIIRIDLNMERSSPLKILAYPAAGNADVMPGSSFLPKRTEVFAKKSGCVVALNATPFAKDKERKKMVKPLGIHKTGGVSYSRPVGRYSALALTENPPSATIIRQQSAEVTLDYDFVFGGFFTILWEGEEVEFPTASFDSRTGAGVSADGGTLYILSVEGERKEKSRGLSFQECAKIFKALGCSAAMQFDGGSSSDLCVNGRSVLSYKVWHPQANSFGFAIATEEP